MHRKYKYLTLGLGVGIIPMILTASGVVGGDSVSATSSITINPGSPVGNTNLVFEGYNTTASTEYYIPVKIDYTDIKDLTISVYARNANNTVEDVSSCSNAPGLGGCSDFEVVNLLGGSSNEYTLDSIASSKAVTDMNNEWGYRYKLANTNGVDAGGIDNSGDKPSGLYKPMYTINTTNKVIAEAKLVNNELPVDNTGSGTKYLNLGFAAGVTKSKEAVTYTGYAEIMVVANPNIITLFDIAESNEPTMQRITTEICRNTPTPSKNATSAGHTLAQFESASSELDPENGRPMLVPEVTLTDKRDGKTYLIRKLADGNCWMVQNLAFDFVNTKNTYSTNNTDTVAANKLKLTSADTDLPEGAEWTPEGMAVPTFVTIAGTRDSNNSAYAPFAWADSGTDGLRSYSYAGSEGCINTVPNPADTICANPGFGWNHYIDTEWYDKGYPPAGNLYNWTAATLGSGISLTGNTEASSSICPKGWRLPTFGGTGDPTRDNYSLANLLQNAYGIRAAGRGETKLDIFHNLLLFLPVGSYETVGFVGARTHSGSWWMSTTIADNDEYAAFMHLNILSGNFLSVTYGYYRGYGEAVRCVAR